MPKILLDIDGVMVITPTWRPPEFLPDGFMAFDTACAENLNAKKIILATNNRQNATAYEPIGNKATSKPPAPKIRKPMIKPIMVVFCVG